MRKVSNTTDRALVTIGILHLENKSGTGTVWTGIPARDVGVCGSGPPYEGTAISTRRPAADSSLAMPFMRVLRPLWDESSSYETIKRAPSGGLFRSPLCNSLVLIAGCHLKSHPGEPEGDPRLSFTARKCRYPAYHAIVQRNWNLPASDSHAPVAR